MITFVCVCKYFSLSLYICIYVHMHTIIYNIIQATSMMPAFISTRATAEVPRAMTMSTSHTHIYIYIYVYIYIYIYIYVCVYIYIYIYVYVYVYVYVYIYIYIYIYTSRGVAYTGYNITSKVEEGDEGEKRKGYIFNHTTRFHCASVAATLGQGPTGGYTCSHRFWPVLCGPKLTRFWDNPKRARKVPLVGLFSWEKRRGGSSGDDFPGDIPSASCSLVYVLLFAWDS